MPLPASFEVPANPLRLTWFAGCAPICVLAEVENARVALGAAERQRRAPMRVPLADTLHGRRACAA
ncbi:MAG: hypothetical protein ACLFTG_07560 [Alphaproteobacteria bacterium]